MRAIDFGVNGWIAKYEEGVDESHMASLGAALGQVWSSSHKGAMCYVGFDGRRHSRAFAQVLASSLAGAGLVVAVSRGACPAPALGLVVARDERAVGGVMVTGSDAPNGYGGLIAHGSDGGSVSPGFAQAVDALSSSAPVPGPAPYATVDFLSGYGAALGSRLAPTLEGRPLRLVVDPLYGVAAQPLVDLLGARGMDVTVIHGRPRADFAGKTPQACEPWAGDCGDAVRSLGADMGIVLDGDGMRSAVIDERGRILRPHQSLPLLIHHLTVNRGQRGRVVRTMPCSAGVRLEAERQGLEVTTVPVGFERLHDEVGEGDVLLACDEFGGVCLPAHLAERDGSLAALLLVEMVATDRKGRSLGQLRAAMDHGIGRLDYVMCEICLETPKLMGFANALPGINPRTIDRRLAIDVSHTDGLKVIYDDQSWFMVRPSRRRPLVRVYAEARTLERRDELLGEAVAFVRGGYKKELGA